MGLRIGCSCVISLALVAFGARATGQTLPAPPSAVVRPAEVIVVGKRPDTPCRERDKACILAVAQEVWTHYPAEIQFYCQSSRTQKAMQRALVQELGLSSVYDSQSGENADDSLPPALSTVCNYKAPHLHQIAGNWAPWSAVPSEADLIAAYPRSAKVDSGDARINCKVEDNGHLEDCHLSDDEPADQGFDRAAMKLAGKFHVNLVVARQRRPMAFWVDVAVHFARAPDNNPVIGAPDWTLLPDPDKLAALYPAEAAKTGVASGVGKVNCRIGEDGGLGDCMLVGEEPVALGFGAAALAAAPQLHANLWTRDGQRAVGGRVIVPLRFDIPAADAPKPSAGG